MSVLEDIKNQVREVTQSHGLGQEHKGFAYWFLEEFEDFSREEAESLVVDGPWDRGRDAVYRDEEDGRLVIYQFKYSEDVGYATRAFTDIQNAVRAEEDELGRVRSLRLVVVTTAIANAEVQSEAKRTERSVRRWLKGKGYSDLEVHVELIDLNVFLQAFERLYGVDVRLTFRSPPLVVDRGQGIVGLLDAAILRDHAENEALFAFNIRKFLGIRKGSVNSQMLQTLKNEDQRPDFWTYNNGIVCLATEISEPLDGGRYVDVRNFTIVNGAQTVSTIARYLNETPTASEPIWVLAKILKVAENDLDRARMLTRTSNTQTPTSNKDLRAVDQVHRRLERWLSDHFHLVYQYRRGVRAQRRANTVSMKDMLQAYAAYQLKKPDRAFSRVGQLFSSDDDYGAAFPSTEVDELWQSGSEDRIRAFLAARVLPYRLLEGIRSRLEYTVARPHVDLKWKSIAYHVLWLYKELFEAESLPQEDRLLEKVDAILEKTADGLIDALITFCVSREVEIPRALKSDQFAKDLLASDFLEEVPSIRTVRAELRQILGG